MSLKLGDLVAYLRTDDRQFDKGLAEGRKKFEQFGGKIKVGAAALAAAVGLSFGAGVAGTLSVEAANDKLATQLGANAKVAGDLGKIAGHLWANAYGESIGQVNEALRSVIRSGAVVEDASNAQIESITARVIDLGATWEQDVGQTSRAVGKMVQTGLAKDANEALDILVRGFQRGEDQAGDLLDTVSEYSTQWRKLGLDGKQALGLVRQGLQGGARDADIVADALKEFSIRAIDGSKNTAAGMKAIGLNADKMAKIFAKGGPQAAKALDTVLDRLRGMKDPVARDAAAVNLFGTQAEDLGDALYSLDPSKAVDALGDVTGAADRMDKTLNDNSKTTLEEFKRKAQQALVQKMADAVPHIMSVAHWLGEHKKIVGPLAAGIGILAGSVLAVNGAMRVWNGLQTAWTAATKLATAAQWLWNAAQLASPTTWIILAIIALIAVIVLIATKTKWFQKLWGVVWGGIKSAALAVAHWFSGPFVHFFTRTWDKITGGLGAAKKWIVDKWDALVGFVKGIPGRISSAAHGMWDGVKNAFKSAINWIIGKWNNLSFHLPSVSIPGLGSVGGATLSTPNIPYLARGGRIAGAGWAWVGEHGPERLWLPRGAQVEPNQGNGRGGGGDTIINVRAFSDRFSLPQVMDELAMQGAH